MEEVKVELTGPYPVRLSKDVVKHLKRIARQNQRSLGQELRFRVMDSWSRISKKEIE